MYDYNLTAQELSDFNDDMAILAAEMLYPTEEEMEEMAALFGEE